MSVTATKVLNIHLKMIQGEPVRVEIGDKGFRIVGTLLGIYLMSFVIQLTLWILSIVIFVIVYGRMIEIYLMTSLAPIPLS